MIVKKIEVGPLDTNCYILIKNNKCLIIDPGDDEEKIKNAVGENKPLAILVTHYHFDHIGALDGIKKYYNVNVIDNKNRINEIDDFKFDIIDNKGHKEDLVSYYFKENDMMFVGDFIFEGSIGRCDLEGGNINQMKESLKKLKTFDKNTILYPGHGPITTLKEELLHNPYLKENFYE